MAVTDVTLVDVMCAARRAASVLEENRERLTDLDQEIGDGDLGITMSKIADVLLERASASVETPDVGRFLMETGIAANRAAASTMGTLVATAMMRAGKDVRGQSTVSADELAAMFDQAVQSMMDRGKAKLGDKTIMDALHPAATAFREGVAQGQSLAAAGATAAEAAAAGRDAVTALQSRIGRAGWVGERTKGKVDGGCELAVLVLERLARPRL